jgi:hypothetical protein
MAAHMPDMSHTYTHTYICCAYMLSCKLSVYGLPCLIGGASYVCRHTRLAREVEHVTCVHDICLFDAR